ncbi:MAG TPA: Hsp70 family protein [Candidatus Faecivivens stercoripullorum]|uniref:Chaperone protein DnaK n=1 Tax=Candidatus Faecivivens stercoripullorum TaxID=2840805 RepID=A0A9D1H5F0_9FIRM|nr:Hsp70 family protein [Candidatus Faecivivens stercoripullorum]
MGKLIGIDLGTTKSCAAVWQDGAPVMIPNREGNRTTPSVVALVGGKRLVGEAAIRQAELTPERIVRSIKREMGTSARIRMDGHQYSPAEISAMILRQLREDAEEYLGEPVTEAVISVPAYFTDAQRQATRDAATIAGLTVRRMLNEPTAAALAYGVNNEPVSKVMVYDLGGGTFDVSVLDIRDKQIKVLATAGNSRLGGDDIDRMLCEMLCRRAAAQFSGLLADGRQSEESLLLNSPQITGLLTRAAVGAKITLSSEPEAKVSVMLPVGGKEPVLFETVVTRPEFEQLIRPLIEMTMEPVRQVLSDSHLNPEDINKVLMVGGCTRIPAVRGALRLLMGQQPFVGDDLSCEDGGCEGSVALGAALQAAALNGEVSEPVFLDVTPLTLGIETMGGVFSPIIPRNTTIPVKKTAVYTTAANFQTSVEIKVYQGERQMTRGNRLLGNFKLTGLKRAPRGMVQIAVTFEIDASGMVQVTARDLATGRAQDIVITAFGNLSRREVERAVADAQRYAREDHARRQEAACRDAAEAVLGRLNEVNRRDIPRESRRGLDEAEKRLRRALKGRDAESIRQASDALTVEINQMFYLF